MIDPSYIDGQQQRLRAWGYKVSEGAYARAQWGRFAGTDEDRLSDLIAALQDPSVDAILCSRGGYGLQRIIDRIPPITKPIIGFSDITALHQIAGLAQQPSLHGIMCKHIATLPEESEPTPTLPQSPRGRTTRVPPAEPSPQPFRRRLTHRLSEATYLSSTDSKAHLSDWRNLSYQFPILLIEDIGERHYHIDRMMRNLRMSGVLAHLSGLIVGQFSDCEDDPLMQQTVYETIKEAVADCDYPVIFDAPFGHVEHNLPLWQHRHASIHCGADGVLLTNSL